MRYRKAFTRILKNFGEVVDIKKRFFEEGIFTIRVSLLGLNLCLLEALEGDDVEVFLVERKIWWEQWFLLIKPWQPSDVDYEILVWLKVMGVPCHAWGEILFKAISNAVGSYVKCEEENLLKFRMDKVRFCIRYRGMEKINHSIRIYVDGSKYMIYLLEIMNSNKHLSYRVRWWDDGSTEPEYSTGEKERLEGKEEGSGRDSVANQKGPGGGSGIEKEVKGVKSGNGGERS